MVDEVGERLAIGGRAARIDREHDIARGGVELVVGREMRAVGGERPAMDLEDQRVALSLLVVGRQSDPGLDRPLVERGSELDPAHLAHPLAVEQLGVEPGELACGAAAGELDVGRPRRAAAGEGDRSVAGDAEAASGIGAVEVRAAQSFRDGADRAVEPDPGDPRRAMIVVGDVDGAAVRGPDRRADAAVERSGQSAPVGAVHVHHVEDRILVGAALVVETGVSDLPSIRGDRRLAVGTHAIGERADLVGGHVERVDLAVHRLPLPIGRAVAAEIESPSVARPGERAAIVVGSVAQLARRAAVGRDQIDLLVAGAQIALAVGPVGHRGDDLERLGPLRAFGPRRRRPEPRALVGDEHRVGDLAAVGRPGDAARRVGQAGDPHRLAGRHPAHEHLGPSALGGRDEGEPVASGRPARLAVRAGAGDQGRLLAAARIDQPDRGAEAVGHDVARAADISDPAAVGADLGIGGDLEVEQVARGEVRLRTLRRHRLRRQRRNQQQRPDP